MPINVSLHPLRLVERSILPTLKTPKLLNPPRCSRQMSNFPTSHNLAWLYRGVSDIFPDQPESQKPSDNLAQLIKKTDHPLRIKLGIDPTAPDIILPKPSMAIPRFIACAGGGGAHEILAHA